MKQELIGLQEEVTKMQNKEGSFKKLENMSDVLSSLNPHLVCELGEELKLHTVEIGKLEKRLHDLDSVLPKLSRKSRTAEGTRSLSPKWATGKTATSFRRS